MKFTELIEQTKQNIADLQELINVVEQLIPLLPDYDGSISVSPYNKTVDFDYPTREETLKLMLALGSPKWEKELCGFASVNYISRTFHPTIKVRIYSAPPPDSCRIVKEEVIIPAMPERKETRYKMICKEEPELSTETNEIPESTLSNEQV
jgi:hypothetical protein